MRFIQLIGLLFCVNGWLSAQDNRRYLMLNLVNEEIETSRTGEIDQFRAYGGNAVQVTVLWSTINNWRKDDANPWQQYDDQIAAARRNGMKIALRIWVDNQRSNAGSDPGNNLEDGQNGWVGADRMQGYNVFGQNLRVYQQFGGILRNQGTFRLFTSYAAPATTEKGTTFAARVAQRYSYLLATDELLFITIGTTGQGEFGYPIGTTKGTDNPGERLYDYSEPMIRGYRTWLKSKYAGLIGQLKAAWANEGQGLTNFDQIQPKRPNGELKGAFTGAAGYDWYRYRHGVMKTFLYEMAASIKRIDNRFKVVQEYGSVYDQLSIQRGSFSFRDMGESLDGVKINDGLNHDFRFSTDVARTNSPGKWIVNEVEGNLVKQNTYLAVSKDELIQQFSECYEHGAQAISIFNFDLNFPADRDAVRDIAARYINTSRAVIRTPGQTVTYTTSGLLTAGGCNTNRNSYALDCQAYKDWRQVYDLGGGAAVNMILQDDVLLPQSTDIPRYNRVLVIGNAMTEQAPDQRIGWTGSWGMAATVREKDYVSLLTEKLTLQNPGVLVQRLRLDDWERTYATKTYAYKTAVTDKVVALLPNTKPDLLLISLSENISQTNFDPVTFRAELLKLVIATGFTTGTVVLRNSFLSGQNLSNKTLRDVAEEVGWRFVNLACLRSDPTLRATTDWPTADTLVKQYPGNAGMEAIANLYCAQIPGLSCFKQLGPVPTVTKIRAHFGVDSCGACSDRCRGGILQASQDSLSWTVLAILRQPGRAWNEYTVNADQPWRYVRYVPAKNCFGELTELEFYAGSRKLTGTPFGGGATQPGTGFQAALDGKLTTVWKTNAPGPQNTVGLDFGLGTTAIVPVTVCPDVDDSKTTGQLELAPNPADNYVTCLFAMPTTDPVTLDVIDLNGRVLSRQQLVGGEGFRQQIIATTTWQTGVYIVRIRAGRASVSKRLVVGH